MAQQDKDEQFEFDMDKTERRIHDQTHAKSARKTRLQRKTAAIEPATVTKKQERKRVEKKYSRKRTETQFLRRNPDMPLSFLPNEEIEKFRSNARGGEEVNNINYSEKSETFRSLEIAKAEAPQFAYYVPRDQIRSEARRKKEEDEKHARSIKMTKELEAMDKLPPIITNKYHNKYEYWKDPADPQWIGSPRTPPADPDPHSYKNPHPDFQAVLKKDPYGYDFGFQALSPEEQTVQMARMASMTPRPSGSSSSDQPSSPDGPTTSVTGPTELTEVPNLVTDTFTGHPETSSPLDIHYYSEKAARASLTVFDINMHELVSLTNQHFVKFQAQATTTLSTLSHKPVPSGAITWHPPMMWPRLILVNKDMSHQPFRKRALQPYL